MKPLPDGHELLFRDAPNASGSESGGSRGSGSSKAPHPFPFIIGVAGGSSSGKSEVCERIVEALGQNGKSAKERQVFVINQDSFYKKFSEKELNSAAKFDFNFDHPNAVDLKKLKKCMSSIKNHDSVTIPQYDYHTHSMKEEDESATLTIHSADVVIVEGILVFYDKELRELFDLKLFVDTDSDTRLARRVMRDTEERGRNIESVLSQYIKFVKPAFEEYCLPTKKYADVIIPRGNDNTVAVSLIVQHIQDLLQCNAMSRRSSMRADSKSSSSGSSRTSSKPSSPRSNSLDHINALATHTTKSNQVPKHNTSEGEKCQQSSKKSKGSKQLAANSKPCHVEQIPAIRASATCRTPVPISNGVH